MHVTREFRGDLSSKACPYRLPLSRVASWAGMHPCTTSLLLFFVLHIGNTRAFVSGGCCRSPVGGFPLRQHVRAALSSAGTGTMHTSAAPLGGCFDARRIPLLSLPRSPRPSLVPRAAEGRAERGGDAGRGREDSPKGDGGARRYQATRVLKDLGEYNKTALRILDRGQGPFIGYKFQ